MDDQTNPNVAIPRTPSKLGEELPIFCEKCGYILHGLPQNVCEHCAIRQFHCPECGHHQPINTLRPAFQKLIGRIEAFWLGCVIFFKLAFFGLLLFAWFVSGVENAYTWSWANSGGANRIPFEMSFPAMCGFCILGFLFGGISRMLLLRWRIGGGVGLVLGLLVLAAISSGARFCQWDRDLPSPFTSDFILLIGSTACVVTLGATLSWSIWVMLAKAFLPARMAKPLLLWQKSLSDRAVSQLARND